MTMIIESAQNEYWYNVADQNEIPIAGEIDKSFDTNLLKKFLNTLPQDKKNQISYLKANIKRNTDLIDILRTLVGISDKRMYLELSYIFSKTLKNGSEESLSGDSPYNLNKHPLNYFKNLISNPNNEVSDRSLDLICDYFVNKNILVVLNSFRKISESEMEIVVDNLILTKEIQQKLAKRRGHGAEYELAKFLHSLGVKIIPADRHLKPMGSRDPNVDRKLFKIAKKKKGETWSFDLIVTNNENDLRVYIQSLIHTSDPGQYGVNKSDETVLIKKELDDYNKKHNDNKELWGLVDGVGFCENKKDTINKMLDEFDNFLQLKSLYKAGLRLHKLGLTEIKAIRFNESFYSKEDVYGIFNKYGSDDIKLIFNKEDGLKLGKEINAGMAWVYV